MAGHINTTDESPGPHPDFSGTTSADRSAAFQLMSHRRDNKLECGVASALLCLQHSRRYRCQLAAIDDFRSGSMPSCPVAEAGGLARMPEMVLDGVALKTAW